MWGERMVHKFWRKILKRVLWVRREAKNHHFFPILKIPVVTVTNYENFSQQCFLFGCKNEHNITGHFGHTAGWQRNPMGLFSVVEQDMLYIDPSIVKLFVFFDISGIFAASSPKVNFLISVRYNISKPQIFGNP